MEGGTMVTATATATASAAAVEKEKITTFVFVTCLVASTGGLIFGYDMGISGGVTSMDSFLKKFFPGVGVGVLKEAEAAAAAAATATEENNYCKLECHRLTMFTSSLYVAALTSSLVASVVTRALGRRCSIFCGGLVFLAGSALTGFAENFPMLVAGRACIGAGVGFAIQSVPVYLSEMAPARFRGRLSVVFQLMVASGVLLANLINYGAAKLSRAWGWRVSLGLAGVPGAIITVGSLALPDTPSSLIERGYRGRGKTMLQRTRGVINVQAEFDGMVAACEKARAVARPWSAVLERRHRPQLAVAVLVPFFQQLTGINVVIFYAPVLLKAIGLRDEAALVSAIVIGLVNVLANLVSAAFVDSLGRRFLLLHGGCQMFICQMAVGTIIALTFGTSGKVENPEKGYAVLVVGFVCVYVAAFSWSWGPLGWLLPSEIFPLETRSVGQSISVSVNMLFTFLVAQAFLSMLCRMKFGVFYFFGGWLAVMTAFVAFLLPETSNVPIEEVVHVWQRHWFWARFVSGGGGGGGEEK